MSCPSHPHPWDLAACPHSNSEPAPFSVDPILHIQRLQHWVSIFLGQHRVQFSKASQHFTIINQCFSCKHPQARSPFLHFTQSSMLTVFFFTFHFSVFFWGWKVWWFCFLLFFLYFLRSSLPASTALPKIRISMDSEHTLSSWTVSFLEFTTVCFLLKDVFLLPGSSSGYHIT